MLADWHRLGVYRAVCDVLDRELIGGYPVENIVLSDKMKREADRLLAQIAQADSMIVAVKAGARADGFVLGLETAGALRLGDTENLYIVFEAALEQRLKDLALV
jgi:hypothetical protein